MESLDILEFQLSFGLIKLLDMIQMILENIQWWSSLLYDDHWASKLWLVAH